MTEVPQLPLAGMLRAELERFVASIGQQRSLVPRVHVGEPGGEAVVVSADSDVEAGAAGWRVDLAERAVACVERPVCAWINRSGALSPTGHDLAWWAACRGGFARHGLPLAGFYVLNRHGWVELGSGREVRYHRIRRR